MEAGEQGWRHRTRQRSPGNEDEGLGTRIEPGH